MRVVAIASALLLAPVAVAGPAEIACDAPRIPLLACRDVDARWIDSSWNALTSFPPELLDGSGALAINDPATYAAAMTVLDMDAARTVDWVSEWVVVFWAGYHTSVAEFDVERIVFDPVSQLHEVDWHVVVTPAQASSSSSLAMAIPRAMPGAPAVALLCQGETVDDDAPIVPSVRPCGAISPS